MSCCCSSVGDAVQRRFSVKKATKELARYRAKGPEPTTRLLIAGLTKAGPLHGRLLVRGRVREVVTRRTEDVARSYFECPTTL